MSWNREQNPTGYSMPAVRPIPQEPRTTSEEDALAVAVARSKATVSGGDGPPIKASTRKADGFAPEVTTDGV